MKCHARESVNIMLINGLGDDVNVIIPSDIAPNSMTGPIAINWTDIWTDI